VDKFPEDAVHSTSTALWLPILRAHSLLGEVTPALT
jgi:hypothetical protein